ncbi:MAG TPA: hypothetical protein VJS44_04210 [Pyrinomonadaceae bacterium]|nr:hypothetical protein [Pyrinomonadaceae bacterium]
MKEENRLIFRADAIRRYMRGRDKSVLPRFTSPRVQLFLWVLALLLLSSGFLAWMVRVPVYVTGAGVVVDSANEPQLAIFLPERDASRLRAGQKFFWSMDDKAARQPRALGSVESGVSSPVAVQKRFNLTGAAASVVTKPVAVALVNLDRPPGALPVSAYVGSVSRVDVEVGEMRAISLLPLIGRFFGE